MEIVTATNLPDRESAYAFTGQFETYLTEMNTIMLKQVKHSKFQ